MRYHIRVNLGLGVFPLLMALGLGVLCPISSPNTPLYFTIGNPPTLDCFLLKIFCISGFIWCVLLIMWG